MELKIISKRVITSEVDFVRLVSTIFDMPVYSLIFISLATFAFYVWLTSKESLVSSCFLVFGLCVSWESARIECKSITKAMMALLSFQSLVIYTSFSGLIIAQLLVQRGPANINTLEDLERRPELRVRESILSYNNNNNNNNNNSWK